MCVRSVYAHNGATIRATDARAAALRLARAEPVRGIVYLRVRIPIQHQQKLLATSCRNHYHIISYKVYTQI